MGGGCIVKEIAALFSWLCLRYAEAMTLTAAGAPNEPGSRIREEELRAHHERLALSVIFF